MQHGNMAVHHVQHHLHGGCDVMYMCTMIIEHKTSGAHMFELVRTPGELDQQPRRSMGATISTTSNVPHGMQIGMWHLHHSILLDMVGFWANSHLLCFLQPHL